MDEKVQKPLRDRLGGWVNREWQHHMAYMPKMARKVTVIDGAMEVLAVIGRGLEEMQKVECPDKD